MSDDLQGALEAEEAEMLEKMMKQLEATLDSHNIEIKQFQESRVHYGRFNQSCTTRYSY